MALAASCGPTIRQLACSGLAFASAVDRHKASGPTFNASVNGRRYWTRFGAADTTRDRYPDLIEPQELSVQAREARLDITKLLATDVLAKEAGDRLLALELCGFLLRKVETYDRAIASWATPTNGHADRRPWPALRSAAAGADLSADHRRRRHCGRHPAGPTRSQSAADGRRIETHGRAAVARGTRRARARALVQGLQGRPSWQLERIGELHRVGGDQVSRWGMVAGEAQYKAYQARLRELLALAAALLAGLGGRGSPADLYVFADLLPAPVQEHVKNYWRPGCSPTS